jgi:hypothetical protein
MENRIQDLCGVAIDAISVNSGVVRLEIDAVSTCHFIPIIIQVDHALKATAANCFRQSLNCFVLIMKYLRAFFLSFMEQEIRNIYRKYREFRRVIVTILVVYCVLDFPYDAAGFLGALEVDMGAGAFNAMAG